MNSSDSKIQKRLDDGEVRLVYFNTNTDQSYVDLYIKWGKYW